VDEAGLPDGIWVLFPSNTPLEFGYGLVEAGCNTLQNFMDIGLIEELKSIRSIRTNCP
jgi:hypothetical protein